MSLLQHIYQRLTWQSSEYSLFETVWPPPPPTPASKILVTPLKKKRKLPSYPRRSRLEQLRLSQQNKNRLVITYRYIYFNKKIKNKWTATKPFHEFCLGNILLFPWFDNKKKQKKTVTEVFQDFFIQFLPWALFHLMLWVFLLYRIAGTGWNFSQAQ